MTELPWAILHLRLGIRPLNVYTWLLGYLHKRGCFSATPLALGSI